MRGSLALHRAKPSRSGLAQALLSHLRSRGEPRLEATRVRGLAPLSGETPDEYKAMISHVEGIQRASVKRKDIHSFAGGLPDPKMFPRAALTRAFLQAIETRDAPALQYGWPEGRPGLRA